MRLTNLGMARSYNDRLQKQITKLNKASYSAFDGAKFEKASEDVSTAARARRVFREMQRNEVYIDNVKTTRSSYDQAQETLLSIEGQLNSALTHITEGRSDTNAGVRDILAEQLRSIQEQIVADLNMQYNDRYIFNGADKSNPPFSLDNGVLYFRGIDMTDSSKFADLQAMAGENFYVDIGMGMKIDTDPITGVNTVVPGTAFDAAFSALNFFGYGDDADGLSNNIVILLGQVIDEFDSPTYDDEKMGKMLEKFQDLQKNFVNSTTAYSAKADYLDVSLKRLENSQTNLKGRESDLMYMDLELAATNWANEQYAYTAALKVGSSILTNSLLDFLG